MENAVTVDQLSFGYENQPTLTDVNLTIPAGSFTLLTGPSGSGKSTLLRLIAGLLPKYGGSVTTGTVKIGRSQSIGMMFQHPSTQFALDTPWHEMQFALENMQVDPAQMPQRINQALDFCGISQLANRQLSTLSGGEQQRVALAEIVCMDASIVLLDEPFASVDERHRQFLLSSLVKLQHQKGKTIILADHDLHGYQAYTNQLLIFGHHHVKVADQQLKAATFTQADKKEAAIGQVQMPLPTGQEKPQLTLKDFSVIRGNRELIKADNFSFYQNRVTLLTGETGVGKSTLLEACAHLTDYDGVIKYQGQPTEKIRARQYAKLVASIFQTSADQFLNVTVGEEIALSQKNGVNSYFSTDRLKNCVNQLGLAGMGERVVYSLSGGQQKKLQILVMLMMGQPSLLLDEPFTGLDSHSRDTVIKLINASRKAYPQTMVVISHQLAQLDQLADFHVRLQNGHLAYTGGLS